ncbi:unnamed protein product [Cladocopium goreaui]|uniref:Ankyrin repeat domain-containing protein 27 (VPS9 domain-containing protein) n=1 Tax=Cladocopium goreaui TaxID=2562237 RepID=A0A9P1BIS3_9DINO|nr:unnamed protein product [Cladocopium goreaui]
MEDEALTMKCLLDLGLDANAKDFKGWTPLMHACARGADEVVRVLVDFTAEIDARNWDGDTALQITQRRRDPADVVAVTKDILLDGIMSTDEPAKGGAVKAHGHMMVSVLEATDLYLEGKTGFVNAYVNLQLRTQAGARPQAAFTSCVLQNSSPEWHEVFRFDTQSLDPSACLVAWVVAAPGENTKEVMDGAALGLDEEELQNLSHMEAVTGKTLHQVKPQFTSALQESFQRLMKRADREEDSEVLRLRKLAMAQLTGTEPTEDLKLSTTQVKGEDGLALTERRWNEVSNLREVLARSGCDVPEPLVPRTHLPLGCVVVRYRHLRQAVWGSEPVTVVRTLRLSCRGSLRVQIDFRPKFFECKEEERAKMLSPEEEDELYRVTAGTEEDEKREALMFQEQLEKKRADAERLSIDIMGKMKARQQILSADEALERAKRIRHMRDPEVLLKRFQQVTHWAGAVLKIREEFRNAEVERAQQAARQAELLASEAKKGEIEEKHKTSVGLSSKLKTYVRTRYKAWSDERAFKEAALDKPIGTVDPQELMKAKAVPGATWMLSLGTDAQKSSTTDHSKTEGRALGGGIPGRISNDLNGTNLLVPNLSPSIGGICKMHDVASRRGAVHVLFHSQHQTEVLDDFWMYRSCSCMTLPGAIFKVPCMHCQYAEVYGMNILVACLEKLSVAVAFLHEIDIQELGYSWD